MVELPHFRLDLSLVGVVLNGGTQIIIGSVCKTVYYTVALILGHIYDLRSGVSLNLSRVHVNTNSL